MKTTFKLILLLAVISTSTSAQMRIFVTNDRSKAEVFVYKTRFFSEAALVVKKSWSVEDLNKPYHWYFVSGTFASSADWVVYYVDTFEEADVTVMFSENPRSLGQYSAACSKIDDIIKWKYDNKK